MNNSSHNVTSAFVSLQDLEKYCYDTLAFIKKLNEEHNTPVSFMCIAVFLGYLSRLAYGSNVRSGDDDKACYIKFIKNFMPQYAKIADRMYGTLRCGLVHAMSFCDEIPFLDGVKLTGSVAKQYRKHWMDNVTATSSSHPGLSIYHKLPDDLEIENRDRIKYDKALNIPILQASELCDAIKEAIGKLFKGKFSAAQQARENAEVFVQIQRPILDDSDVPRYKVYPTTTVSKRTRNQIKNSFSSAHSNLQRI